MGEFPFSAILRIAPFLSLKGYQDIMLYIIKYFQHLPFFYHELFDSILMRVFFIGLKQLFIFLPEFIQILTPLNKIYKLKFERNMSTNADKEKEKQRAKKLLMQKLKSVKIKSEGAPSVASVSNHPVPVRAPKNEIRPQAELKSYSIQPEKPKQKQKSQMVDQAEEQEEKKYPNQEGYKQEIEKDVKKSIKTKRPYYQHYSKEGVFEPVLDYVRNHPNPSGKPDNIPPQMYQGIQVVPKRPWVFFGPENIPTSDCKEINQQTFLQIFAQAKKNKGGSGLFKKSNKKKGGKRNQDEISQVSDQFTSNFTFSDSVDLSKQSDLISQFRSQTKTFKVYDSSAHAEQSQAEDDFSSMSGSVTQRHRYNLFDSSQSQMEQSSIEVSKRRKKFKKLLQSSDEEPDKSTINRVSSVQASSAVLNSGSSGNVVPKVSSKGSSERVQIDQNQSSISKSRSKSKSRTQMKPEAPGNRRTTRQSKVKKEQESD